MIRCRVLGPVEVTVDGAAPPPELLWRKNLALLVYLARSPRRTRTREHLIGLLWGDRQESAARHSLREAMRVLRRATGDAVADAPGDQVRLDEPALELDVTRFEALCAGGEWSTAAELVQGEFLEGFGVPDAPDFENWLAAERLALRQRSVEALVRHGESRLNSGDLIGAADAARRALALDPLAEAGARLLMTAYSLSGDRGAALAVYDRLVLVMRHELSAEPDDATRRLADRVRRQRVYAEAGPGAEGAASRRAPLVGRDAILERALGLWKECRSRGRSATAVLEGDPGAGRSRLAEELIARARLDGAAVAMARAVPADAGDPWSGVFGIARGGLLEAGGIAGASPQALAAFAARLDEWADRFPATRREAALEPRAAFTAVLRAAAAEQPVVVAFDDAHWLDRDTLISLGALPRDLADVPVFLALTATMQPQPELDLLRAALGRDVPGAVLRLEPLGPEELRALARWAMPRYNPVETDRLARRLAADTAGLPLLAVEILHAVALGLDVHGAPQAWPEQHRTLDQTLPGDIPATLTAAVRVGFQRLGKDAQSVLAAAAVLGDRVDAGRLAHATGLPPEAIAAALDEAEWQRWLSGEGRGYTFLARIVRDIVARDMLTAGQRQRIAGAATRSRSPAERSNG